MIGIAAYVGAFAFGRMAKGFTKRAWLLIFAVAVATTLLSALITPKPGYVIILVEAVLQFLLLALLFALGIGLGRWLDRNKNVD